MSPLIAVLSAVAGYLLGAVSFARIVLGVVAPQATMERIALDLPDSDAQFTSDAVSATTVRLQIGPRYGCLTSILDMVKVFVPTLALRVLFPDQPYFLIAAAAGVAGHVWPIYHRFRGGRGQSPIFGGLLVIDWTSIVVTNLAGLLLGRFVVRSYLVVTGAWIVLLVPWLWLRFGRIEYVLYALAVNAINWLARAPELRQYAALKREGKAPDVADLGRIMRLGEGTGRLGKWLGLTEKKPPKPS
jgi:glycerol-3-phosphate acyltransferase PlsY